MDSGSRNALVAAACIVLGFGLAAFFLPTVMLAVGEVSPLAAGVLAVAFVAAFFGVFWLRSRHQNREGK